MRFVHECESRWGVDIVWLEWRDSADGFERVGYNSASRSGEPFANLIAKKQIAPNWQARWCTGNLKVTPMIAYMASIGHPPGSYAEIIGLRADEGARVLKMEARNRTDGRRCLAPLAYDGVGVRDVRAFWNAAPFDLQLRPGEGNCDLCFLKGAGLRKALIRERPWSAQWWIAQEAVGKGTFSSRQSYADLVAEVRTSPTFFEDLAAEEYDVECGLMCGNDSPAELAALQAEFDRRAA